jgi:hypothetical protein
LRNTDWKTTARLLIRLPPSAFGWVCGLDDAFPLQRMSDV